MRSPRAVNRTHTRCTPIHAHHSKGQRLSSLRALHKAIRHSLVNQDAYAEKASLIFGQLDLKLAEFMKKAELSEEERVEKERRAALKKVEKDAQVKAKKEAEQRRKQEKLERKQAEAATKQTIDPKLEAATYIPQTVVVEESKPLKKEETKKNKKTEKKPVEKPVETPVEVKEEPIVKIEAPSPVETKPEEKVDKKSKKDKKEKKKSESEKLIDEVKLFEATATPKNTPIDTPKEAPATPAEYDLEPQPQHQIDLSKAVHEEKKSKKNKKEKKESESKAEEVNNEKVKAPVEELIIEKVEQVKQEATPEVNGVHETESVKNLPDLVKEEEKTSFIIDEKEGEGSLGKIGKENDDFEIGVDERPIESHFKETLQNAGVEPVRHWETQNEGHVEEEQKEGLLTTLAETVTGIWDSVTAGILGSDEKDASEAPEAPEAEPTSGKSLFKDETEETITAKHLTPEEVTEKQAEQTPDIWEEFTSGKPLFKDDAEEKSIVVKTEEAENVSSAQATPEIWEEFTSGKPLFKEDQPVIEEVKVVEEQTESQTDKKVEQAAESTPDIWEEFTSGKPLFKEVNEPKQAVPEAIERKSESETAETSNKKSKNKKNKDKRSKNSSESTKESEVVQIESPKVEKLEVKEEKKNENKKKDRKSKKSVSEDQVEKELRTELKDSPSEMSMASMVVNISLNEDQEDFNATQPEIEPVVHQEIQPEEETQFVAVDNKKNKKKDKRPKKESERSVQEQGVSEPANEPAVDIWEEFASGKPLFKDEVELEKGQEKVTETSEPQPSADQPVDIWEEFTSGKPLFKDESEFEQKFDETPAQPDIWEEFTSGKPLFKDNVEVVKPVSEPAEPAKPEAQPAQPAELEAQPHEVTYGSLPLTGTKKNNKKHKKEKKTSESHEKPDKTESSEFELAIEKDIFQKLKPADLRKSKSKSPEPENLYVWDGLVSGVPIIKAVTSPTSSPKKISASVVQEAPSEHKEGLLSSLAETVTGIWEDLTSGKPLFSDNEKTEEKVEQAAESTPDIWEEFTSGKPLFKEEVNEPKQAVPEAIERKSESETAETSNKKSKNKKNKGKRSTNPSESAKEAEKSEVKAEPAAEPTPDIWEEFTSGKPLFKDELPEIPVSDVPIQEQNPEPIVEATPDIWEEFTSGKPLFKDNAEVVKPVSEPVQDAEPATDIWEEFTSGKPLFKDESVPTPSELEYSQSSPNPPTSLPKEDPVKDKKAKKDKKNKKTSESEAKVEVTPEAEKVEEPVEHKEPSKKDKKKNKKNSESEPKVEPVEAKIEVIETPKAERLEEPVSIQIEEKESKKDKKKNKKEKKTSESQSQFSPDSGVVIEQDLPLVSPANLGHFAEMENAEVKHIDVEPETEKVTATVTKTEPEPPKQDTKESKSKKKDKKHKKSESENNVEVEPVKENGHPVVEEKKEEPVELKYDAPATQPADTKSKDKKDNKKKNKKGKTNSESEQVVEKKSPSPVKEVQEKPIPEPTKVEPVATPSPTNNGSKNKKKNKGKHGKDNDSPVAVEEKQSPVSSGKFDPVEEASHQHVEDLKSAQPEVKINGINGNAADDHGFEEQKGKKGRKKNKSRSSESHELNGKFENAQVITELNYNNDDVNKMGIESTSEQVEASPVQVNEVTSSEATEGNQKVYRENIKAAYDIDSSADPTAHPTQFAIQVQKLVESTLAASELKHADPNTKYSVQAQLLRLKEHDDQPKQTYTLRPLTPLAFERHVTVEEGKRSPYTPSPRERSYKLLPKDVLFCSYMIDTYGEDYEGMTKDAKNVYRENARSLQRKMRVFKESPHFDTYKKHQETGQSVEEILQEEAAAQA